MKLGQMISLSDRLPERGGPPGFLSAQRSLSEAVIVPQDVAFRQSVIARYEIWSSRNSQLDQKCLNEFCNLKRLIEIRDQIVTIFDPD